MKKILSLKVLFCVLSILTTFSLAGQQDDDLNRLTAGCLRSGNPVECFANALEAMPEEWRDVQAGAFISSYPRTPVYGADTVVGLYWYGKANEVHVAGDVQKGWSETHPMKAIPCGEESFFYITYTLPRGARVDYQLIIDGQYTTDPRNPKITPSGYGPHSEIAMPGFVPDRARAVYPGVPRGTIDSLYFTSNNPHLQPRPLKVYLPADYVSLQKMPVLYVVDGLEALEWMNYQNVMDNLIAWKRIRPTIAVFIPPGDRGNEFMGAQYKDFQDALCNEVVPLIDSKYDTGSESTDRGITGISAGGYFALMTLMERSDVFGCGSGQSPAVTKETFKALEAMAENQENPSGCIYFDIGRYDLQQPMIGKTTFTEACYDLHREMDKLGISHKFLVPNDGHEWANWRERLSGILIYFFGDKSD